mmetsp:Transcript_20046/g.35558  ORF Transcript_20046/g.35558 Transcript_20046/m.35558 type:complete len:159 (-) Transcript_20046:1260-1736(-)
MVNVENSFFEISAVSGGTLVFLALAVVLAAVWMVAVVDLVAVLMALDIVAAADIIEVVLTGLADLVVAVPVVAAYRVKTDKAVVPSELVPWGERRLQVLQPVTVAWVGAGAWKLKELAKAVAVPMAVSWELHMEQWENKMAVARLHMGHEVKSKVSMG